MGRSGLAGAPILRGELSAMDEREMGRRERRAGSELLRNLESKHL